LQTIGITDKPTAEYTQQLQTNSIEMVVTAVPNLLQGRQQALGMFSLNFVYIYYIYYEIVLGVQTDIER